MNGEQICLLRVSRKLITRKAKAIHDEINEGDPVY